MNIHFYILFPFPNGMASAKRCLCYAKGLMAAGDNVDFVISQKAFYTKNELPKEGYFEDIHYNYVCGKYKSKNKIKRGLDFYLIDLLKGFWHALQNTKQGDIIYCYFYSNLFHLLLLIVAKIKKAKIVREVCEHPSALNKPSLFNKLSREFEYHCLFPFFDAFIPISFSLDAFVSKYKSNNAKTLIVPILVDASRQTIQDDIVSPYSCPYILHTGTMNEQKDSISKILQAFARFKKTDTTGCKLVFTGPQANSQCKYIPMIENLGIKEHVELLGMVSVEDIDLLQHFAALSIIYKSDNLQTRNCFPTKLGEMLSCGIPVIITNIGDANKYLQNGVSACIIPDNNEVLVETINRLILDKDFAKRIGKEGRKVALTAFSPIQQGKRMHDFFSQLLI